MPIRIPEVVRFSPEKAKQPSRALENVREERLAAPPEVIAAPIPPAEKIVEEPAPVVVEEPVVPVLSMTASAAGGKKEEPAPSSDLSASVVTFDDDLWSPVAPVEVSTTAFEAVPVSAPGTAIEPAGSPVAPAPTSAPAMEFILPEMTLVEPEIPSAAPVSVPEKLPEASSVPAGNEVAAAALPAPLHGISLDPIRESLRPAPTSSPRATVAPPVGAGFTSFAGPGRSPADERIGKAIEFRRMGAEAQAIEEYRRALELDPRHPVALNNLADIYISRGENLEQAIELLEAALAVPTGDRSPFLSTMGWAHAAKGDYSTAEKYLTEAIKMRPTAERLYRRGVVHAGLGLVPRARADFDRALVYVEDAELARKIREELRKTDAAR